MIFKSGDKLIPSSWRPIAGQETSNKLFTSLLADRLQSLVATHSLLPTWQRATSHSDGCHECNLALDLARDAAKYSHTQLHLIWLDICNAFGSVNRDLLVSILARFGLSADFVSLVRALYSNNTQLYDDGYYYRAIPERVGVKQGDPLSALLFSFYLAPVMLAISSLSKGFRLYNTHTLDVVAFADDMLLFAPTHEAMSLILAMAVSSLKELGLQLNIRKCISLSVSYAQSIYKLSDVFYVGNSPIPQADSHQSVKYLGRPYDESLYTDLRSYSDKLLALAQTIENSNLFPWYKLDALNVFVFSKLHYLMRVGSTRMSDLTTIDNELKQVIRCVCALPPATPKSYIEGPSCCGCLGFPSLNNWRHAHTIAQFVKTINDTDSPVSEIARTGFLKMIKKSSIKDAVPYVCMRSTKSSHGFSFIGKNHWLALTTAIRALNSIMEFELVAPDDRVFVKVGLKGDELHVLPMDNLFHHLCLAIHRVTFASVLASRRGPVFKHFSAHPISLSIIKTGWGLSSHEWQFIHKARLDLATLPSRPYPGTLPSACKHCHTYPECIHHVLSLCKPRPSIAISRHDTVLWRLVRAILSSLFLTPEEEMRINPLLPTGRILLEIREGIKLYVNLENPYAKDLKRPDILFIDEIKKFAYIIDVQIVVEDNEIAFSEARKGKIDRYSPLRTRLKQKGFRTCLDAFLIGGLGSVDPANSAIMQWLNLPPLHYHCVLRFMCSQVTKYACDMYHAYIAS